MTYVTNNGVWLPCTQGGLRKLSRLRELMGTKRWPDLGEDEEGMKKNKIKSHYKNSRKNIFELVRKTYRHDM